MEKVREKLYTLEEALDSYLYYDKEALYNNASYSNGLEDGIKQGIQQGVESAKKEMVKNMIQNDYNIESIMKITNLSNEEIEKIRSELI